jgi:hypothetical protein
MPPVVVERKSKVRSSWPVITMRPAGRARHTRKLLNRRGVPRPGPSLSGTARERSFAAVPRRRRARALFRFRFGLGFAEDFLWTRSGSRVRPVSRFHSS